MKSDVEILPPSYIAVIAGGVVFLFSGVISSARRRNSSTVTNLKGQSLKDNYGSFSLTLVTVFPVVGKSHAGTQLAHRLSIYPIPCKDACHDNTRKSQNFISRSSAIPIP